MIKTRGLTHIALAVEDVQRSARFYSRVFGMVAVYEEEESVQLQTPGTRDVLVLETAESEAGLGGGIQHFGFRLIDPADIDEAAKAVESAGGTITSKGEFCPGSPYLFFNDPDGYEVEVWYEMPTPIDPA